MALTAQRFFDEVVGLFLVVRGNGDVGEEGRAKGVVDVGDVGRADRRLGEVVQKILGVLLQLFEILSADVFDLANGVVPGKQAEPVAKEEKDEDRGDDGEEAASVLLTGDQRDDVEERLQQRLNDVLETAGDEGLLHVAQPPIEDEGQEGHEDDDDPGREDGVSDAVAAEVDDLFRGDGDNGGGRFDQKEADDDEGEGGRDDAVAPTEHAFNPPLGPAPLLRPARRSQDPHQHPIAAVTRGCQPQTDAEQRKERFGIRLPIKPQPPRPRPR